jgi:TRAP-type mannitol/chloroaromatic compound transport system permease small subunit
MVYCYICSILLLVTGVNLLLHLIYKLNFIIGTYVEKKMLVYSWDYVKFQASPGGLTIYPMDKRLLSTGPWQLLTTF